MMMRTVTVVRQYLAPVFLIVIGLIASGCGDTASVTPAAQLASLTVNPGTLQPAFNSGTTQYNVDLSNNITSVTITAQPAVAGDTITINGQATTSSVITLGAAGTSTPVSIVVSETGTAPRTYIVFLVRAGLTGNNSLQNLTVSPGTLDSPFDPNVQAYTVNVDNNIDSITVTPTLSDTAATMTVNGQAATSGQASTIFLNGPGQSTAIPIVVTAQNGSTKTYTVTVSRGISSNNNLGSLTISPGTLNFSVSVTTYNVNVASNVDSVRITPTLQDTTASMSISVNNGQPTDITSGQARTITLLGPGTNTFINIVVTAQNGTQKTYSVNVIRAALGGNNSLRSLTVSPGTLTPPFDADVQAYTIDVDNNVGSIRITPTLSDRAATMTVNGQAADSGRGQTITLNGAGSNTSINLVVTAPNGNQKIYTVTVQRAASSSNNNLSALAVTPGSLAPAFDAATQTYSVDVTSDVTSVTVTATLADTNASMTINGQGTSSGQTSNISLGAEGSSTAITIVVTAPNGSSKTYTVTANRAAASAPPMPARAPDLIARDDSCLPPQPPDPFDPNKCDPGSGTSRKDNITNITTPRFQISQPRTGETPNLYVDGTKVNSSFDPATKTLKPTAALNNGGHTITYTVANAGAESPQSPPLTVIIDTVAPSSS